MATVLNRLFGDLTSPPENRYQNDHVVYNRDAILSFVVAADEFETASNLLQSSSDETITRASGIVARVALERHFRTVAQEGGVTVTTNPPSKAHPDFTDITLSLRNAGVITEVQRARVDVLYRIENNRAHPKEVVNRNDVEELIRDGRSFTGLIV